MVGYSKVAAQLVASQEGLSSMSEWVVGWDGIHLVRGPLVGLLYYLRKMPNMKQMVEWELGGEAEVLGEDLTQCNFIHHKSQMTWPEPAPGKLRREAGD
jgi:hypothetical protein